MKYIKNYTKPILFFTIGILLFSLIQSGSLTSMMYKIQANLLQGLNLVKITEEKSEINDEELTIRFKVPSIHYEDKQVERNINNYIRRNIKEYVNVQRQVNKINRYSQKHSINVSYSVVFEDENMINILIEKNTTWGKNDYKMEKDSYVFNLKNGERIYLDEFLKDNKDYSRVITDIIQSKISKNHPLYNNLNIDKNTNYYIEDRYINIYFNPYKQSQDDTQYEFKVPYDVFKNKVQAFNNFFFITVNKESIKKDNKYLKSNLEIPVINSDNSEIDNKVNKKIRTDIMHFYEQSLKEAENFLDDFNLDNSNFVADSSFEVKKSTSNVISILVKYYKYSGGAHGYYEYIPYNIDLRNGNFLVLKDLFKEEVDYKTLINNEIENQIKQLGKKEKDINDIYEFYGIKDNQKFYLEDKRIVIYFDLYDIAPYAAGIPEFPIPIDNIKNKIKEEHIQLII